MEQIIFNIIINSGEARSFSMEAIEHAKEGNFDKAQESLELAVEKIGNAHKEQTQLIQSEAGGQKHEVSLLMVHAQDHLMTSMTVKDLANEFVELYNRL